MTPSQEMGAQTAQTAQSPRQGRDLASPNSSVSKPLPVVLEKNFQTRKCQEILERVTFQWEEQKKILGQ